jgi:hypothetical protein
MVPKLVGPKLQPLFNPDKDLSPILLVISKILFPILLLATKTHAGCVGHTGRTGPYGSSLSL